LEWKLLRILIFAIIYCVAIVFLLRSLNLWDITLLKDSIFWFVGALAILGNAILERGKYLGKNYFKELFTFSIIIDLVLNFESFPIWIELIALPFLVLWGLAAEKGEGLDLSLTTKKAFKSINKLFTLLYTFCCFTLTVLNFNELFTWTVLKALLLPIFLFVTFYPFIYLVVVLCFYEILFVRLDSLVDNEVDKRKFRKTIILVGSLNLSRLEKISQGIASKVVNQEYEKQEIPAIIRQLAFANP
ncbi:MAG: hypothetical protein AAFV80_12120, partial [Bacteroidota bacterium]